MQIFNLYFYTAKTIIVRSDFCGVTVLQW